jgi:hypothetical protein
MRAASLLLLLTTSARGQVVPERELEIIRALYDAGDYAEAARRANETLGLANFTDVQRVKLHEVAALSAFNLGDTKAAQASFLQLLRLNPDYILDPFAVPPPAIKLFDQVRRDNADTLNVVRQQIALRLEREKRELAEKERLAREQEERRRRVEELTTTVTVRTVERRSLLVNLLPFGTGQFVQGRVGWGVAFAVSEGLMAVLSIVSFFAIESLFEDVRVTLTDRVTPVTFVVRQIPASRTTERNVWSALKYGTGIAFYTLWALGAGEALWHHQDEIVTERKEPAGPKSPAGPTAHLRLFPTAGGLGAGVAVTF